MSTPVGTRPKCTEVEYGRSAIQIADINARTGFSEGSPITMAPGTALLSTKTIIDCPVKSSRNYRRGRTAARSSNPDIGGVFCSGCVIISLVVCPDRRVSIAMLGWRLGAVVDKHRADRHCMISERIFRVERRRGTRDPAAYNPAGRGVVRDPARHFVVSVVLPCM